MVGQPELTDAGWDAMDVIMSYVFAAVGSGRRHRMRFEGDTWQLLLLTAFVAVEAEARVPGLWELSLDDVHQLGRAMEPPAWVVAHNRSTDNVLRLGPDGPRVMFEPYVDPEP